jgi:transketolase
VIRNVDGHDPVEIKRRRSTALAETDKPTPDLLPDHDRFRCAEQGRQGIQPWRAAGQGRTGRRRARSWAGRTAPFEVPEEIRAGWSALDAGAKREAQWKQRSRPMPRNIPSRSRVLTRRMRGDLPEISERSQHAFIATSCRPTARSSPRARPRRWRSNAFAPLLPELVGGSADLAHSNLTLWKGIKSVAPTIPNANYVYYGVREFGMTAIANGLALHGGFIAVSTPPSWCSATTRATRCA